MLRRGSTVIAGAVCWLSSGQFFLIQLIVQLAWTTPYSLLHNYISDLGNTACYPTPISSPAYICSPLHIVMNASFILLGVNLILGAFFTYRAFDPSRLRTLGLALIGLAGFGLMLVGFAPENVNTGVHVTGAALQFVSGNLGMIVLGALFYRHHHVPFGRFSMLWGSLGLIGLAAFLVCRSSQLNLGLGVGGWERVIVYPLPLWAMIMGLILFIRTQQPNMPGMDEG